MENKIEVYLKYCIGQPVWICKNIEGNDVIDTLTGKMVEEDIDMFQLGIGKNYKPILRPLSTMTEEEMKELLLHKFGDSKDIVLQEVDEFKFLTTEASRHVKHSIGVGYVMLKKGSYYHSGTLSFTALTAAQFHYLLSLGFDLFGLIDGGLAIDATQIKQTH